MGYGFHDITLYYLSENGNDKDVAVRNCLISDLYIDFLDGYKPKGTSRISADIGSADRIKGYFGSILSAEVKFNDTEYLSSPPDVRNKIVLDTIHRVAILGAKKYGWDKGVFDNAYCKVLECNFIYKKELKKKFSKDKKHQASLLLEKNGEWTMISASFYDFNGEFLKSVALLKSFQSSWFYEKIKSNKWFNNLEFGIYTKNNELVIKASLGKESSETVITPITTSRERLEGYLRRITYQEISSEADYIKWANQ
jgi:hypothetical protein